MSIKNVKAEDLKKWMDKGDVVLVDVREPAEHRAENIEGAKLVPLSTISKSNLPDAKGKKLVIHCRSGGRSNNACLKLLQEDPNIEVYNLEGGISAWAGGGHAVIKSGKAFLPLDRQVQLTIGLFVLGGSLLAYYLNPLFTILTGFMGAGLTFAGLSGYCGLAMFMAKMPWNKVSGNVPPSCSVK